MTKERKEFLDNLWKNTDFGQWIIYASESNAKKALDCEKRIASKFPFTLDQAEKEVTVLLKSKMKSYSEFEEYIKTLKAENQKLVDFLITRGIFGL